MNYLEQPLAGFLGLVASGEPVPGGGAEVGARLAREATRLRPISWPRGVRAATMLVEINTMAAEMADDRVERAGKFVTRAIGAARGIAAGDG